MAKSPKATGDTLDEALGLSESDDVLSPRLTEILERMPADPGVYLMKDKKGRVVYVGKASSLRARVRSYFNRSGDTRQFVSLLGRILGDIETVVTNNAKEALLLENNLIKQHQPRFNVKLVDDKNYLVLRLDPRANFPRLEVTRRIGKDGAKYFGPYHSASSCRATLQVVNRHFKLRTCSDSVLASRRRPCLQYQIKRCDAPCVYPVAPEEYGKQVQDVALFLEGKDEELFDRLEGRMRAASAAEEFEIAAAVRDQLRALERTLEEQRVVSTELRDQDVVGLHREGTAVEAVVLHIRNGKLLGRRNFSLSGQEFPTAEIVSSLVQQYFDSGVYVPDEVLLPVAVDDAATLSEWLSERRDPGARRVEVLSPQRGTRHKLVELADKNAASSFASRRDRRSDAEAALAKLQDRLSLKKLPRRVECFDISHIQGTATVGSMVVFLDGEPAKKEYRVFKVKSARNDDFASMYEVLSRRFRRGKQAAAAAAATGNSDANDEPEEITVDDDGIERPAKPDKSGWVLPDLLVIDGGKGQLSTALAALRDAQIDVGMNGLDVIGLAKEREDQAGSKQPDRVFLARAKDPIQLRANTAELFLLARIRDEAHRFAVTFHKKLRRRRTLRSALEDVPGVGARRQRELLRHFGSLKKVRAATVEELARVPGMSLAAAEAVVRYFAAAAPDASETVDAAEVDEAGDDDPADEGESSTEVEVAVAVAERSDGSGTEVLVAAEVTVGPEIDPVDITEDAAASELAELTDDDLGDQSS